MTQTSDLHAEHVALHTEAEALLAIVAAPAPDAAAAIEARRQFARSLRTHCLREDRDVYDWLLASGDAVATPIAWRCREDFGRIESRFDRYAAAWPRNRIETEWSGFAEATGEILGAVLDRMVQEERMLYPLVRQVQARRSARASAVEQRG